MSSNFRSYIDLIDKNPFISHSIIYHESLWLQIRSQKYAVSGHTSNQPLGIRNNSILIY